MAFLKSVFCLVPYTNYLSYLLSELSQQLGRITELNYLDYYEMQ